MKFLISWQFHEGKLHDTILLFSKMTPAQEQALMGDKVKLLGRWHDVAEGRGVAIYESESAEALAAYALNWNKYMDLEVSTVIDDDQVRAIGIQMGTSS